MNLGNIRQELVEGSVTVYNLQIEKFHTYYAGAVSVLVHNANYLEDTSGIQEKSQVGKAAAGRAEQKPIKNGKDVWDMAEGGGIINGREYSQHAMERMAPDTPSVRAELSRRAEALAESKGLQVGTPEYYQFCQKYVAPRNIPPSVIEDAIRNTPAVAGHTAGTFVHQTADITVIVNEAGKLITAIQQENEIMFIKFDDMDMLEFFENEPISIGEEGEAKFIYSIKDSHQFSMTLMIDTYANIIDISVRYNDNAIFAGEFDNVLEVRKSEDVLLVEMENNKRLMLKKYSCLGVVVENV